jgi:hypothetical protein
LCANKTNSLESFTNFLVVSLIGDIFTTGGSSYQNPLTTGIKPSVKRLTCCANCGVSKNLTRRATSQQRNAAKHSPTSHFPVMIKVLSNDSYL